MPRAEILASILKETGSTGLANAVMSLNALAACNSFAEVASVTLGASAAGGAWLITLAGGAIIDAYHRKKDLNELKSEFRELHKAVERFQQHAVDSKEWHGLLSELLTQRGATGLTIVDFEKQRSELQAAFSAELKGVSTEMETWFRNVGVILSNIDERLRSIDAKQDTLLEGQSDIRNILSDQKIKDQTIAALANELESRSGEVVTLRSENETLRTAIKRYVDATPPRPWRESIAELQANPKRLIAFLDDEVNKNEADLIEKHLERADVCLAFGEVDKASASVEFVLKIAPHNLDALNRVGNLHIVRGQLDEAYRVFSEIGKVGIDEVWRSISFGGLGLVERIRGNLLGAEKHLRSALAIDEQLGRPQGVAIALSNLGLIEQTRGNLAEAEVYHKRALAIDEILENAAGMSIHYGNLGIVEENRGELDAAEDLFVRALAIDERLGRKDGIANQLGNLALIQHTRGNLDVAEEYLERSLCINQELGRLEGVSTQYANLGLVQIARGNLAKAEESLLKALDLENRLGSLDGAASVLGNLGLIKREKGDLDGAFNYFTGALDLNMRIGRARGVALQHGNLGGVELARGQIDQAEQHLLKALAISREHGLREGVASNLVNLGILESVRGHFDVSRLLWTESLEHFQKTGATANTARVSFLLASLPPPTP